MHNISSKSIKAFLETSDSPYAIIMEDDCVLDTVHFWNFLGMIWLRIFHMIGMYFKLQLFVLETFMSNFIRGLSMTFSTACYMITRHHAEKLVRLHCRGDKYKLDNGVKPRPVADDLIYNSGNTFSMPLLLYRTELGSSIHPEHVDIFHKGNFETRCNTGNEQGKLES